MKTEYEKDYFPLQVAFAGTILWSVIFLAAAAWSRLVEITLEVAMQTKATNPILDDFTPTVCISFVIGTFILGFVLANYLHSACNNGILSIPYKLDYEGNKIPKTKLP